MENTEHLKELLMPPLDITWYVEPGNSTSRENIIRLLQEDDDFPVGTERYLRDNWRKKHLVLKLPNYFFIDKLNSLKNEQKLVFVVFSQIKGAKYIRAGIFGRKKRRAKNKSRKEVNGEKTG